MYHLPFGPLPTASTLGYGLTLDRGRHSPGSSLARGTCWAAPSRAVLNLINASNLGGMVRASVVAAARHVVPRAAIKPHLAAGLQAAKHDGHGRGVDVLAQQALRRLAHFARRQAVGEAFAQHLVRGRADRPWLAPMLLRLVLSSGAFVAPFLASELAWDAVLTSFARE